MDAKPTDTGADYTENSLCTHLLHEDLSILETQFAGEAFEPGG